MRPLIVIDARHEKPLRAPPGDPYPISAWFTAADTNHDWKIDAADSRVDFQAFFNELDVDHDGRISSDEITRYEREVAPEVQVGSAGLGAALTGGGRGGGMAGGHRHGSGGMSIGGMGGAGSFGGRGDDRRGSAGGDSSSVSMVRRSEDIPPGAGRFGLINSPEPVAAMDTDMSGLVTRAEAQSAADRRFNMPDRDNQGFFDFGDLA